MVQFSANSDQGLPASPYSARAFQPFSFSLQQLTTVVATTILLISKKTQFISELFKVDIIVSFNRNYRRVI